MPAQPLKDASLWTHFSSLKDGRMERCRKHSLQEVLIISICSFLGGLKQSSQQLTRILRQAFVMQAFDAGAR